MNSSFRHSGVDWLGEVPNNWNVIALKRYASYISRGRSPDYTDDKDKGIPIINQACIYWDGLRLENVKLQDPDVVNGYRGKLYSGDLLINSTGTGTLGRIGVFNLNDGYLADSHVTIVRPTKEVSTKYLYYLLQTDVYQGYIYSVLASGSTNQIELSREGLSNIPIIIPPSNQQESIARFLDRKTLALDALIAKKQRLIQLLEEKRTALINQVITKGLNPNAAMKYSGILWIGEIPEHWEVKKLKWLCPHIMVGIVVTPAKYYVEVGIPCLRSLNVKHGKIIGENLVYISEENNELLSKSKIFTGDLVCVRTGQPGATAVVDEIFNGINCIDLIIIRKSAKSSSEYISLVMNSEVCRSQYSMGTSGSIQQHFNVETATNLIICNPPLNEQLKIVKRCHQIIRKYKFLIQKVLEQIEKLQEYRRSLITAAVTGKLDIKAEDAA